MPQVTWPRIQFCVNTLLHYVFWGYVYKTSLILHWLHRAQEWYVSITLQMQRAYHILGGNTISCWAAERPYSNTALLSTRIMCWGSPLCFFQSSFSADCKLKRLNQMLFIPIYFSKQYQIIVILSSLKLQMSPGQLSTLAKGHPGNCLRLATFSFSTQSPGKLKEGHLALGQFWSILLAWTATALCQLKYRAFY